MSCVTTNILLLQHKHSLHLLLYLLPINFYVSYIIFKNSRNINFWKLILAEHYKQASFTTGTISNNDKFLPYSSHEFCKFKIHLHTVI